MQPGGWRRTRTRDAVNFGQFPRAGAAGKLGVAGKLPGYLRQNPASQRRIPGLFLFVFVCFRFIYEKSFCYMNYRFNLSPVIFCCGTEWYRIEKGRRGSLRIIRLTILEGTGTPGRGAQAH